MNRSTTRRSGSALAVALAIALPIALVAAPRAIAQNPTGLPPGVTREQMWPAPTAEDWKKPCLIQWQRTWDDAVAVSRETGKPILICVNMDGEIASEHYAGVRYRDPEKAKLFEPYVCVIASVYRHTPRDHDDEGRRIPCPRFGTVTCGEHIAIEPILYEKYFDGQRVAPRHIGVELDQSEMYDVYYAWDTDTIFNSLRDGVANRKNPIEPIVRGDRPIVERVASRDLQDRTAVESAYAGGDRAAKRALLEAALAHPEAAPLELLRLALFGYDAELSQLARKALALTNSPDAVGLISDALRVPMEPAERDALIAALTRLGESSPRAKTLAVVHRGLAASSGTIDEKGWKKALDHEPAIVGAAAAAEGSGSTYPPALEARIEQQEQVLRSDDPAARVELAEAFLRRGLDTAFGAGDAAADGRSDREFARCLYLDAQRTAQEAQKLGAPAWRVDALLALSAYYLGDAEEAHARAESAVKALPAGAPEWSAMAVLELFAKMRAQAIAKAQQEKRDWPPQWLTDVHSACTVLAHHPLGTDAQVAWHYDVLVWLGANDAAAQALNDGLARFAASPTLHERLRRRILAEKGRDGLEPAYEKLLQEKGAAPELEWFAGFASLLTAEFERRGGTREAALAAYERAIAHYEKFIAAAPDRRESADRQIAIVLAGRARIAYESGDDEAAVAALLASFERKADAAATEDGLNLSAVGTARVVLQRLNEQNKSELAAKLDGALQKLDPELLALPAYERDVQNRAFDGTRGGVRPDRPRGE